MKVPYVGLFLLCGIAIATTLSSPASAETIMINSGSCNANVNDSVNVTIIFEGDCRDAANVNDVYNQAATKFASIANRIRCYQLSWQFKHDSSCGEPPPYGTIALSACLGLVATYNSNRELFSMIPVEMTEHHCPDYWGVSLPNPKQDGPSTHDLFEKSWCEGFLHQYNSNPSFYGPAAIDQMRAQGCDKWITIPSD
jgi:hypothetical protein